MGHALVKHRRLSQIRHFLLIHHEHGSRVRDIAAELGIAYNSAFRYLNELGAIPDGHGRYRLCPTPEDIELARAVLNVSGGIPRRVQSPATPSRRTDLPITKQQRLEQIRRLLLLNQGKSLRARDLADALGIPYHTAWRYLGELGAVPVGRGRYRLTPTPEDIELAQAVLNAAEYSIYGSPNLEDAPDSTEAIQARSTGRGYLTQYRLEQAKLFLLSNRVHGVSIDDLANELGIACNSAYRYLSELNAIRDGQGKYRLLPTPEDIELAHAVLEISDEKLCCVPSSALSHAPQAAAHPRTKHQRLGQLKRLLLLSQEQGLTAKDIADCLGILPRSTWRYLSELGAISDGQARYRLTPTPEDIELAEAVMQTITTDSTTDSMTDSTTDSTTDSMSLKKA